MLNPQDPPFTNALKKAPPKIPVYLKGWELGLYLLLFNSILTGGLTEIINVQLYTKLWWLFFNNDDRVDLAQASSNMATSMQTREARYGVFHSFKIYGSLAVLSVNMEYSYLLSPVSFVKIDHSYIQTASLKTPAVATDF